jgi:hypothetical protein
MEIRVTNDAEGCPKVEVIQLGEGGKPHEADAVISCVELAHSQQVTITAVNATEASDIEVGEVTASPEETS